MALHEHDGRLKRIGVKQFAGKLRVARGQGRLEALRADEEAAREQAPGVDTAHDGVGERISAW